MSDGDRNSDGPINAWLPSAGEAWKMVGRRWWIVLLATLVGSGAAVGGALIFRPVYQAAALIEFKPPSKIRAGQPTHTEEVDPLTAAAADSSQMVRRIISSLANKQVIVPMFKKYAKHFTAKERDKSFKTMRWLANHIKAEHRGSFLYRLSNRAKDPKLAQLLNAYLAEKAIAAHRNEFKKAALRISRFTDGQLKKLSAEIKAIEDEMVAFLQKHPSLTVKSLNSDQLTVQGADRLRTAGRRRSVLSRSLDKLAEKDAKLKALLAKRRRLERELRGLQRSAPGDTAALTRSLEQLRQQLRQARAQGMTTAHPVIKNLAKRIKKVKKQIADAKLDRKTASSKYEAKVRAQLTEVRDEIKQHARAVVKTLKASAPAKPKGKPVDRAALEAEWARLRRDHKQKTGEYTRLQTEAVNLTVREQLVAYEAKRIAKLIDAARVPEKPVGVTRPMIIIAGSVFSLLLGVGLALLLGILDPKLRRPEQLRRVQPPLAVLAVLVDHPLRLQQAQLLRGELLGDDPVEGDASAADDDDGGSVIKWLKKTDDLDSAIGLLTAGDDAAGGASADDRWLDDVQTTFVSRNAPAALGQRAERGLAVVDASAGLAAPAGGAQSPLRVRTLPSAPPLAPGLFVSTDPASRPAEQMRLMAARMQSQIGEALRVVAVASWERGVGKTTVAANLAMVLAEAQKRVLAIDACPGRAALTRTFGIEPDDHGLCEQLQRWLDGGTEPWEVVQIAETLTVLPAGQTNRPALPLLSSEAFARLVNDLTQLYDALVIDTEPLEAASDAVVLQQRVDGYVIVTARDRSTTTGLRELTARIETERLLGAVFNYHG